MIQGYAGWDITGDRNGTRLAVPLSHPRPRAYGYNCLQFKLFAAVFSVIPIFPMVDGRTA